jgi:WhiB family redox-sensing transcriptional regulator
MNLYEFVPTLPKLPNALCRDYEFPDLFFPDGRVSEAKSLPLAQAICAGCPERKECLEYALNEEIPYGIWAGTTPEMRGITVEKRKKQRLKPNIAEEIRQLHKKGRTQKEIAKQLQVQENYVTRTLKRAKLEGESQSQPIKRRSEGSQSSSGFQQ